MPPPVLASEAFHWQHTGELLRSLALMARTKSRKSKAKRAKAQSNGGGEKRARPAFGAKSEFVRARPNKTAQEIVAEATEHGLPMTVGHVYNIRAIDKKKGGTAAAPSPTRARAPQAGGDVERELRTIVARIGLDRAEAVFAEVRAAFAGASPTAAPRRRRVGSASAQSSSESGSLTAEQADAAA